MYGRGARTTCGAGQCGAGPAGGAVRGGASRAFQKSEPKLLVQSFSSFSLKKELFLNDWFSHVAF